MSTEQMKMKPLFRSFKEIMSIEQVIKLVSKDGVVFEVSQKVAFKSQMIKDMCENMGYMEDFEVDVPTADGITLKKVIEYCEKYQDVEYKPKGKNESKHVVLTREHEKLLSVSDELLTKLVHVADFLDIPDLLALLTQKVANMIKDKQPHEIRRIFMLPGDSQLESQKSHAQKTWQPSHGSHTGIMTNNQRTWQPSGQLHLGNVNFVQKTWQYPMGYAQRPYQLPRESFGGNPYVLNPVQYYRTF